jgi:hypothetical protein
MSRAMRTTWSELSAFGDAPAAVRALRARIARDGRAGLRVAFELDAEMAGLALPEFQQPRSAQELWRHTCFEAFVGAAHSDSYYEFNFAPSRAWACYRFERYRDGDMRGVELATLDIDCTRSAARCSLTARFDCPWPIEHWRALRVGLCAVIETRTPSLSYWALAHPRAQPDFHDRAAWLAELE